jgi:hypothetical protein
MVRWFKPGPNATDVWLWTGCIAVDDRDFSRHCYFFDWDPGDPIPVSKLADRQISNAYLRFQSWPSREGHARTVVGLDAEMKAGISEEIFEFPVDMRVDEGL